MINFILVSKIKKQNIISITFKSCADRMANILILSHPRRRGEGHVPSMFPYLRHFLNEIKLFVTSFFVLSNGYCRAAFLNCESIQCSLFLPQVSSCKHFQENKIFANRLFNNGLNEIILNIFT